MVSAMRICRGATSLNALSPPIIMLFLFSQELYTSIQVYNLTQMVSAMRICRGVTSMNALSPPIIMFFLFSQELYTSIQVYNFTLGVVLHIPSRKACLFNFTLGGVSVNRDQRTLLVVMVAKQKDYPSLPYKTTFVFYLRKLYTSIQVYNFALGVVLHIPSWKACLLKRIFFT